MELIKCSRKNTVFLPGEKEEYKDTASISLYPDLSSLLQDIFRNPF